MKTLPKYLKFAIGKHKKTISLSLIFFLLALLLVAASQGNKNGLNWWSKWVDPILGVGTFLAAIGVWINNLSTDWEDDLPKRLSILFMYEGRAVMMCEEAYLASEGDIRAWGQQIGSQMSGKSRLDMQPYIKQEQGVVRSDEQGKIYKYYLAIFYLNQLPIPSKELAEAERVSIIKQLNNGGITWTAADFKQAK